MGVLSARRSNTHLLLSKYSLPNKCPCGISIGLPLFGPRGESLIWAPFEPFLHDFALGHFCGLPAFGAGGYTYLGTEH